MWHVSSRSGVATLRTAIHLLLTYLPAEVLLRVGRSELHTVVYIHGYGSLAHVSLSRKRNVDRFVRVHNTPTHRHADHATCNMRSKLLHLRTDYARLTVSL